MTNAEILQEVHKIIAQTDSVEAIRAYSDFEKSLSPEERVIAQTAVDAFRLHRATLKEERVWVLIHGINTEAVWQEHVRSELRQYAHIRVENLGFGFFDVVRFVLPMFGRWVPVNKIRDDLRHIKNQNPGKKIGIVAHSFGTYVTATILKENSDIEISQLLLCGGIIPRTYAWHLLPNKPAKGAIVNEVGTLDKWPILAGLASWSYGPSGAFGFKGPHVHDRYFHLGHSDFFTLDHVREFWLPFILRGEVKEGAADKSRTTPKVIWSALCTPWPHAVAFLAAFYWIASSVLNWIGM